MSFRCQSCDIAQDPGTRPTRIVTETRERTYFQREYRDRTGATRHDHGGVGVEVAAEIEICPTCVRAAAVA